MSVNVRFCPLMSVFIRFCPFSGEIQSRLYGKAELALLYHPFSTPETAVKILKRWIKGCPQLVIELESLHYYPKLRTFLSREVEAIVKHLGEP